VLYPDLRARVEQGTELTGLRIEGGEIAPFVAITPPAGECQVVEISSTTVLLRYDMIYLVWKEGHISHKQAILASVLRALNY
jgi:hypothetical protein